MTMTRSIAVAAVLIALGVAGSIDAPGGRIRRNATTISPAVSERAAEAKLAMEDWPICSAMATIGSDTDWAQLDPDFAAGTKALAAGDWNVGIASLKLAALRDPRNADIQNYLGYAYRRLHQLGPAMGHYQQALTFNPRHRGAHQHLGELFLVLGEPAQAQEHLAALERICLVPCAEFEELERAIAAYPILVARGPAAGYDPAHRE